LTPQLGSLMIDPHLAATSAHVARTQWSIDNVEFDELVPLVEGAAHR
jgi:hypothetical protein